jgi:hypothetical protein
MNKNCVHLNSALKMDYKKCYYAEYIKIDLKKLKKLEILIFP